MKIAIHQPNFLPPFKFFQKMAECDLFVILKHCQFEKGGYQNRQKINGKWWTYPVERGLDEIHTKNYKNGVDLVSHNMRWIYSIREMLDIKTPIDYDFPTDLKGTERLIEICRVYGATEYLTNPEAVDKYLNEDLFDLSGIKLVPFKAKDERHLFEVIHEFGIEGTRRLLK